MKWARTRAPRLTGDHPDDGFTLVELIITILLISTAILALLGAWKSNIQASVKHRDQSEVQTKLVSAANWVASTDVSFVACNTKANPSADVQAAYNSVIGGLAYGGAYPGSLWQAANITVSKPVEFWNSLTQTWVTVTTPTACPSPASPLQRVTLSVTHPTGSTTNTIEVVKSDVWTN